MKNKVKIALIVVIIVLICFIVATIILNQTGTIDKIIRNTAQEEIKKEISYEVYQLVNGKTAILVTVEDTENGIDKIVYPDNEMEVCCNGKTKVTFDYNTDITGKESLTFTAINTLGEEIKKTILINDQFYLDLINYSIVDETETQKALTVNYKPGSTTKQYRIGEATNWTNYTSSIRLDDYQILETLGNENEKINIELRQVDKMGYEIRAKVEYNINENTTYRQEDTVIEGESILACVENNNLASGNYIFRVTGSTDGETSQETIEYPVELYNYHGDANYIGQNNIAIGDIWYTGTGSISSEKRMLILKYNGNLTINSGVTITPTGTNASINGATYLCTKKGMYIYCAGTLTNNGTITMTAKGTVNQVGENVYLYKNKNNTYEYVPEVGGKKGGGVTSNSGQYYDGNNGKNGLERRTGGGASGGTFSGGRSGSGSDGTSYSGGTGGGGCGRYSSSNGSPNGGAGGNGKDGWGGGMNFSAGGAGNPGGRGDGFYQIDHGNNVRGATGTGGLLIISANNITNNGIISSNGSSGGETFNRGGGRWRRFWSW